MTTELKKAVFPIDTEIAEFILWSKEENKVIDVGHLSDLEEKILDIDMDLDDINDYFELIPFNPLRGVDFKVKKNCEVSMDNDTYSTEEETFEIYDGDSGSRGPIYETSYEDDALEELANLIKECGREDRYNLIRKVEYTCTYDVDIEDTCTINIPEQQIEVEVLVEASKEPTPVELMTKAEIDAELHQMYSRLQELSAESRKRDLERQQQEISKEAFKNV